MSLRINTNVSALSASRSLGKTTREIERSAAALASGSRITTPGDDSAGFAISENLRSQKQSLTQSISNAGQAQSLLQVAEGALNEQSNILVRLRELAVQASSDTVGDVEREFLQVESQQLVEEFDRIARSTRYGQAQLLTGDGKELEFYVGGLGVGPSASDPTENVIRYSVESDTRASSVDLSDVQLDDKNAARSALGTLDSAAEKVAKARASFGSLQSRLGFASSHLEASRIAVSAAYSQLADTDVALETSELLRNRIQQNVAVGVLAQANSLPESALRLL